MRRRLWRRAKDDDRSPALETGPEPGPDVDGDPDTEPGPESFDELVARQLRQAPDPAVDRASLTGEDGPAIELVDVEPGGPADPDWLIELGAQVGQWDNFWDRYDQATAEAKLAAVAPAAITAVVGPLQSAIQVTRRCRDQHWSGQCDVFVLTADGEVSDEPDWTVVSRPSDLVSVLTDGVSQFPMLVLDVPFDLPAFVRPLVERLRACGVGLVHYVLDGEPTDEDLATWYGELGQPAVLDLAGPVDPGRVLELLHRGEPVVSVAGMPLTDHLLLALRLHAERSVLAASD